MKNYDYTKLGDSIKFNEVDKWAPYNRSYSFICRTACTNVHSCVKGVLTHNTILRFFN